MKKYLLFALLLLSGAIGAQVSNDECSTATQLQVNTAEYCNFTTAATILGATASYQSNTCAGAADDDVWFQFIATASSHKISFKNITGSTINLNHVLYEGTSCSTLIQKYCSTTNSSRATGLTIGQAYTLRVYTSTHIPGQTTSFNVCVSVFLPPINDTFNNAVIVPVNPDLSCSAKVQGTMFGATITSGVEGCGSANIDVWYQFTATGSPIKVQISKIESSVYSFQCAIYSSGNGSPGFISCLNTDGILPPLPQGNIYKLKVSATSPQNVLPEAYQSLFSLCLSNIKNDNCENAVQLPVHPGFSYDGSYVGTTSYATQSAQPFACTGTAVDDVWYTFTATKNSHYVNISAPGSSFFHSVYSGSCNNLMQRYCSEGSLSLYTNYIPGQTYWVRVYSGGAQNTDRSFTINIATPMSQPANDDCVNAITLPVALNGNGACEQSVSGVIGRIIPASTAVEDVWFKFVAVSPSVSINFPKINGLTYDLTSTLYKGSCNSLNFVYSINVNADNYIVHRLTVGESYYIKVRQDQPNFEEYPFRICVSGIPAPSNDSCANPTLLPVNTGMNPIEGSMSLMASLTSEPGILLCNNASSSNTLDVWYEFTAIATTHVLKIDDNNIYIKILYSGNNCNELTAVKCMGPLENIISGLVIGQTYRLRFYANLTQNSLKPFKIYILTPPSPPVYDFCSNSLVLPVNPGVESVSYISATTTSVVSNPTEDDNGRVSVWFEFTATSATHQVKIFNNTDTGLQYAALYNSCDSPRIIELYLPVNWTFTNLLPGTSYRIKLTSILSNPSFGQPANFDIAIVTPPQAPPNDVCSNVVTVPVNTTLECVQSISGTTASATQSAEPALCASSIKDDIWFKFTATSPTHHITLKNLSNTATSLKFNIYKGIDCNSMTQVLCNLNSPDILRDLVAGEQYFIRVFSGSYNGSYIVNFDICIGTPAQPFNDECTNALSVPVNNGISADQFLVASVHTATASANMPQCNTAHTRDAWFTFTATSTSHGFLLYDQTWTGNLGLSHTLYSGSCDALTQIYCDSAGSASNLVIGQEYIIRVSTSVNFPGETSTFKIAVVTNPYDDCNNSPQVPVNDSINCTQSLTGSFVGATISNLADACRTTLKDVWFEFTATSNTHIITTNVPYSIYTASCDALSQFPCSYAAYNNFIPGETYKLRLYNTIPNQTFSICITTPLTTCTTAPQFTTGYNSYIFSNTTGLRSFGQMACLLTTPNPAWFKIKIDNPGTLIFNVSQNTQYDSYGSTIGQPLDVDLIVWGPFASVEEGCEDLSNATTLKCDYSTASTADFNIPNGNEGEFYLVLITNYSNHAGFIKFVQTGGTGSIAVPAPTGLLSQTLSAGSTLADINVNGQNVAWYGSAGMSAGRSMQMMDSDATLPLTTPLVDGETYYASQTIYGVESLERLAVTVHLTLGTNDNLFDRVRLYPNPVSDLLNVANARVIDKFEIYSLVGQLVKTGENNSDNIVINMSELNSGVYFIKLYSDNQTKTYKVLKIN